MNFIEVRRPASALPMRYLLVFWLLVMSAVAYLDRTNISIAGVQIGREFGIDNAHLGWVFSAFLIGYAAFQIPAGILARKFGPRRLLAVGVVWWGVFTALTALASPRVPHAMGLMIAIRCALGAGEAVMYPAATQFVERWFPIAERGKANGIIFGGVGLGAGLTPPMLTAVILNFGWRSSFWLCAGIGVAAGLVWFFIARDTPEEHARVSQRELDAIVAGRGGADEPEVDEGTMQRPARSLPIHAWFRKEMMALFFSYFTYGYVAWIFFSWFYIYLAEVRGLNLKTSAVYSMMPFIAMTLGSLIGGVASDWIARHVSLRTGRCVLPALALGSTAALLWIGSRASDARLASLVLACGAGALYVSQSCYWSVTADFAGSHSGVAGGIMNMGGQAGGAVTASLTPFIAAQMGWNAAFFTATVLVALGAMVWLIVNPKARLVATNERAGVPVG